jgi:hypothetical protein
MTLPEAELSFFFAAAAQLEPDLRPVFAERVSAILGAHPDPGPGDVDRAVSQALVGLWTPPESIELRAGPRWDRNAPAFERGLQTGGVGSGSIREDSLALVDSMWTRGGWCRC